MIVRLSVKDETVCCPGCGSNDIVRRGCEVREFRAPPIAHRCVSLLIDVPRVQRDLRSSFIASSKNQRRQFTHQFQRPGWQRFS